MKFFIASIGSFLLLVATASATVIMPRLPDRRPQPVNLLHLESETVKVTLKNEVAEAVITHTIRNSGHSMMEAEYLYPIPPGAAVRDFAVELDGVRLDAELLDAKKAEGIYRDIVRKMKDPGLLTYHDSSFLRVRAFPVPPNKTQKVEVRLAWPLTLANGGWRLALPLFHFDNGSRPVNRTIDVTIHSTKPITAPYSPTHPVKSDAVDKSTTRVSLKGNGPQKAREFVLLYSTGKDGISAHLMTGHDSKEDSEAFMIIAAPELKTAEDEAIPRDVILAFDTSGSMAGDKIKQAREALTYCLHQLEAKDRFAVLRFSTEVEAWEPELQPVNDETRKSAINWVAKLKARGGTDISGALERATKFADGGRTTTILFLTDGKPTIGEADTDTIVSNFKKSLPARTRAFVFGVGHELNAHLLDKLARAAAGDSRFVAPNADIEVAVSELYDAISHPVLTDPTLTITGVETNQVYPKKLPDLFAHGQLNLLGRYAGSGTGKIKLTGEVAGKKRSWTWDLDFPKRGADNAFVAPIWAKRKIGYLLDSIRLNGESSELKDEVIKLGKQYGIVTPYTSYLAVEDGPIQRLPRPERPHPIRPPQPIRPFPIPRPQFRKKSMRGASFDAAPAPSASVVAETLSRKEGEAAVQISNAIREYKAADLADDADAAILPKRTVAGRNFVLTDGQWRESGLTKATPTSIKWGSDAFFKLYTEADDTLKEILGLGQRVRFNYNGKVIQIEP